MVYGAAITLYNPDELTFDNIKKYQNYFDYIILFDNSDRNKIQFSVDDKKIIYIDGDGNKGLSFAYNRMLDEANKLNIDYLCMIDQDSLFLEKDINSIKIILEQKLDKSKCIALGPYINYTEKPYSYSDKLEKKSYLIASGTFINMKLLNESKIKFDEKFFIDRFDVDFCMQINRKGYDVIMYYGAVLNQKLGDGDRGTKSNHNEFRHYHIFLSRLYFNKKWFKKSKSFLLSFTQSLKHFALIIFYENNKIKKIRACKRALHDYRNNK